MTKKLTLFSCFFLLLILLGFVGLYHAFINCPDASYLAINGDFQNFNPIQRLRAGQVFFKDFDIYTGMGPNLANFILSLFVPFNFYNSKIIVYTVIFWHYVLLFFTLFRIVGVTALWALSSTVILLIGTLDLRFFYIPKALYSSFESFLYPGISIVPLRFGIEIWTIFFLFITLRRNLPKNLKKLTLGIILGSTIPWSNDFGFATYIATSFIILMIYLSEAFQASFKENSFKHFIKAVWDALHVGMISIVWCFTLLALLTKGHVLNFIEYCVGVAQDQSWYFLPNEKIFYLRELSFDTWILLFLIIGSLLYSYHKKKSLKYLILAQIILTTHIGGLIKTFGSNIFDAYNYQSRNCIAAIILGYVFAVNCIPKRIFQSIATIVPIFLGYCVLIHMPHYYDFVVFHLNNLKTQPYYVPKLGASVSKEVFEELEFAQTLPQLTQSKKPLLFSTYAGPLELMLDSISPSRIDYIIHALGKPSREAYVQSLKDLDTPFVSTIHPRYTPFEEWLRKVNWNFYQVLIDKYQPFKRTIHRVFWEKRTTPLQKKDLECSFVQNSLWRWDILIKFPGEPEKTPNPWIVDVQFDYKASTSKVLSEGLVRHHLSLYRDLTERETFKHPSDVYHAVGVPLYETHWQFGSVIAPGETKAHILMLKPEVHGSVEVQKCNATALMPLDLINGPPPAPGEKIFKI